MDYSKLKVVDLKAQLKKRGLPQAGLKQELIDRLNAADAEAEATPAEDVAGEPEAVNGDHATEPEKSTEPQAAEATAADDKGGAEPSIPIAQADGAPTQDEEIEDKKPEAIDTPAETAETDAKISSPKEPEPHPSKPIDQVASSTTKPLEPKQAEDDTRKRKRRSVTPEDATPEAQKKLKQEGVHVELREDTTQIAKESGETEEEVKETTAGEDVAMPVADGSSTEVVGEPEKVRVDSSGPSEKPINGTSTAEEGGLSKPQKDARYKSLFTATTTDGASDHRPDEPDTDVSPALHPATPSLYIRNFMRPLQPGTLKAYLLSLAVPSSEPRSDDDSTLLQTFFLDPIRTHCFCTFATVAAASRVRSALHGRVWPDERTRKALWADFVPSDKLDAWIEQEQQTAAGGPSRAGGKRWEIVYEPTGEDSAVEAILREVDPRAQPPSGPRGSVSAVNNAPPGPRSSFLDSNTSRRDAPPPSARLPPPSTTSQGPLSTHPSTTSTSATTMTHATPALSFAPVSPTLADRRLAMLARRTSARFVGRPTPRDNFHRYTFEDGDILVTGRPDPYPFGRSFGPAIRGRGGAGRGGGRGKDGRRPADPYERGLPPPPPGRQVYDREDDAPPPRRRPSWDDEDRGPPRRARDGFDEPGARGGYAGRGGRERGSRGGGGYGFGAGVGFGRDREEARPKLDEEWPRDRGGWAR